MNSTFRARWLASWEVISQVLFTSEQPKKNKMAFVGILSQIKLLFGPLIIQLVWYILKQLFTSVSVKVVDRWIIVKCNTFVTDSSAFIWSNIVWNRWKSTLRARPEPGNDCLLYSSGQGNYSNQSRGVCLRWTSTRVYLYLSLCRSQCKPPPPPTPGQGGD